jgi:hypothetical protein
MLDGIIKSIKTNAVEVIINKKYLHELVPEHDNILNSSRAWSYMGYNFTVSHMPDGIVGIIISNDNDVKVIKEK